LLQGNSIELHCVCGFLWAAHLEEGVATLAGYPNIVDGNTLPHDLCKGLEPLSVQKQSKRAHQSRADQRRVEEFLKNFGLEADPLGKVANVHAPGFD
jgi:hypothetical protein